jgi:hypothetical protein
MKISRTLIILATLVAILALIAAGVGVFYQDGGNPFAFTTVRGDEAEIYGQGLYRFDTSLIAVGYRAIDAVILVLCIPVLVVSILLYRRGSLRGGLVLAGALAFFLYNYGSMAIGAAYNNLFLIYLAIFSASLFALVLALASFDLPSLPSHFTERLPRRGISIFLIVSGIILALIWLLLSILPALLQGKAPAEVSYYTTFITGALDIAIIAPALILTGVLLVRRAPLGYLLSSTMLAFTALLGISLLVAGIAQMLAGVMGIGQFIGFSVPFAILTLIDIYLTIVLLRDCSESATVQAVAPSLHAARA